MSIPFVPLGSRVLIDDIPEKYDGKLIISATSKEKPTFMGVVLAIGPLVKTLSVGDVVYIGQWSGQMANIDGKSYRTMPEADVIGKLITP
jgi:co-chaperonin GroES (HSP10)